MEEAEEAGGSDFYDRVYNAERPELFFKATPHRVVGPGGTLRLRSDSKWIVPEPELTVVINKSGRIVGYTAGDDLSCRDIEGDNPLYLPQAKVFDRCAALGPAIWIRSEVPPSETEIALTIEREGRVAFYGATDLNQLKKPIPVLIEYLFRDNAFPVGCLLMTGTGIVPPNDFSLKAGDSITVRITEIGELVHRVG
jgi:2-dehydro-3-deoxy-D-arabinonate dehydratase